MKKSYTVMQTIPSLVVGGVERGSLEITSYLSKMGNESIICSSGGPLVKEVAESGGVHIALPVRTKNPIVMYKNHNKIVDIIKEKKVDIVHSRSRAPAWSSYFAAKKAGIPFVTTFHGIYNYSFYPKKFYNSIMAKGDIVIAISKYVMDHVLENYNMDPSKIRLIYRGVNVKKFSNECITREDIQSIKAKYYIPESSNEDLKIILLPARFSKWKGHMNILRALKEINDINFMCIMTGDMCNKKEYVLQIQEYIEKNHMKHKVQIFAPEYKISHLYSISDIVLSASTEPEAFGRTVIEAQSMKKIVIASNLGGTGETIEHGVTGFHFDSLSYKDLAEKIYYAFSILNTKEGINIGENARKSVIENFSLETMCKKTTEVYEELLNPK